MIKNWEDFEFSAYNFILHHYGNYTEEIIHYGKSDSLNSDIFIRTLNNNLWIEVKKPKAQSGQFVLLPDENKRLFDYSAKNKYSLDKYSQAIIDYMNESFDKYFQSGTKGSYINLDEDLFYDWIINYYHSKGVEFIITFSDDFVIFPTNKIKSFFNVKCKYREKKSGSSSVKNEKEKFKLISKIKELAQVSEVLNSEEGLFFFSSDELDKCNLIVGKYHYMIKRIEKNKYEVRRLSNTRNSNIIFELDLRKNIEINNNVLIERLIY